MFWLIKAGKADLGYVMGVDTLAHPAYYFVLFGLAGALSYKGVSTPFGKERDGFILAEGAVCAFLAELEFVKRNKLETNILAEVVGYGATCDAKDMTAPDAEAGTRAVESALKEAQDYGLDASAINFWSAHGTSTPTGDQNEADIIERVIKSGTIYVSSTKAHIGHMVGPAGLAGVLTAAHACFTDRIPTMGYYEVDPSCKKDGIAYVTGPSIQTAVRAAISVAFGFGGQNAAVVIRKYEG